MTFANWAGLRCSRLHPVNLEESHYLAEDYVMVRHGVLARIGEFV